MSEAVIPFLAHCGVVDEDAPAGVSRLSVVVAAPISNTRGHAHGGLLMTMLDVALGRAVRDSIAGATGFITIDLQTAFLTPGEGRLVAEGRAVGGGRNTVFAEGEVRNAAGEIVAKATGVFKPVLPRSA